MQQRRFTIATETLSTHYATKLEKQAFKRIKEWKEGFSIKLDHVLKQRQHHMQDLGNPEKTNGGKCATGSFQPAPPCKEYTIQSFSNTSKPIFKYVSSVVQDPRKQLLIELRGVSEISYGSMGDSSGCDTGSMILHEIKKQRRSSKGRGENKKLMEDLSSWHRQEAGRITSDMWSYTSDVQDVKRLLSTLKETVDTIFTTTIQKLGDFANGSTMENNSRTEYGPGTLHEEALLRYQITSMKEDRDRLFMENSSLKKQIGDLRNRLDEVQKDAMNLTSIESDFTEFDSLEKLYKVENYVGIEDVQKAINRIKEYVQLSPGHGLDLQDMDERMAINGGKKILLHNS